MMDGKADELSHDEIRHMLQGETPVLVWDGECGFCRRCVEWLRTRCGNSVEFIPYQMLPENATVIGEEEFEKSVFLFEEDGQRTRAAEAVFRSLSYGSTVSISTLLYDYLPGFSSISEWGYRLVAANRSWFSSLTEVLVGKGALPSRWQIARFLFFRLFAVIYGIAFLSLAVQVTGLLGENGIVPAVDFMDRSRNFFSGQEVSWWFQLSRVPTIFWWISPTSSALLVTCVTGAVFSMGVLIGFWPRFFLLGNWVLYASLVAVGNPFMSYQWDALLLEMGFLSLFLAPSQFVPGGDERSVSFRGVFLMHWLLFRLMFSSGAMKILGAEPVWNDQTALTYHFWTQPLPNRLSYYMHQLPESILVVGTTGTLIIEFVIPFFIFLPRRFKRFAACSMIGFQMLIMATGNYGFFNLLAIALCVLLLDDAFWRRWIPTFLVHRIPEASSFRPVDRGWYFFGKRLVGAILFLTVFCGSGLLTYQQFRNTELGQKRGWNLPEWTRKGLQYGQQFHFIHTYGLFVNMTTERPEIVIEGSRNGRDWKAYEFQWKPDEPTDQPGFVAPHQPRLDWQMWFQALAMERQINACPNLLAQIGLRRVSFRNRLCLETGWLERRDMSLLKTLSEQGDINVISWTYQNFWGYRNWFLRFLERLFQGRASVLDLLADNPFPEEPPQYIRIVMYDYRFPPGSRSEGRWWKPVHRKKPGWVLNMENGELRPARKK